MTDNKIIKALECCMLSQCKGCPYVAEPLCHEQNCRDARNLITRQKADLDKFTTLYANAKAESERLSETLDNITQFLPACTDCEGKTPYGERTEKCVFEIDPSYCGKKAYELFVKMRTELETAKAEAVKEFAERLKGRISYECGQYATDEIDNLVKEMVGDV